jgi:hypothetical protein
VILAIDPGTEQSGWCVLHDGRVYESSVLLNGALLKVIASFGVETTLAIEMIASYGMPVGKEVFETCVWIGRFQQAWRDPEAVRLVYRKDVKLHLCGSPRAKDANIWQALKDRLGEVGTKKNPGPLYGVSSHARSALAVAVTVHDLLKGAHSESP